MNHRFWKYRIITLALSGLLMIGVGVLLLTTPTPVQSQTAEVAETAEPATAEPSPQAGADYVGASECRNCHRSVASDHADTRHALTLQEAKPKNVQADFSQGEDVRMVQFPGEDAPRAFTLDDLAYVVGSGRNVQRFLYEVDRNQFRVLPAEWNVAEQKWEPYTPAGDDASWDDVAYDWNQSCAGCHTTGLNVDRGRWKDDGVQCEDCHGPGSAHVDAARDASRNPTNEEIVGIRAAITVSADAQVCGACHSQGVDPNTQRPYSVDYRPGDDLSQYLTLSMPDDSAHWSSSGHAAGQNMQYNEWLHSGHANSLKSMEGSDYADETCLECHSGDYRLTEQFITETTNGDRAGAAPDPVTLTSAQYGVTCTSCHSMHASEPLDYELNQDPYVLCVSCHADDRLQQVHNPVKAMFEGEQVIDRITGVPSKHFTEGAICTDCHMPDTVETGVTWHSGSHTMSPVFPGQAEDGQPDSCTGCHTDLSRDYMQRFVENIQSGVLQRLTAAQAAVDEKPDTPQWVLDALAFVSKDGSLGVHNYSYTSTLLDAAALELGIVQTTIPSNVSSVPVEDPTNCAECHADQYRQWQASPHANASLDPVFLNEFAAQGRPSYCMSCHASGYDPRTERYSFEGVVCSDCHYVTSTTEHPPGPVEIATDSAVCGKCHTGEHAPTYDEWLVSNHGSAGIDCVDCHTPHNNGLILDTVNDTCESCHSEAKTDDIHMGQDMTCVDCHMVKRTQQDGVFTTQTGHSMLIDPGICANCHGNIHLLSSGTANLTDQEKSQLTSLETQVGELKTTAADNLNTGIVGGAIGALVLVVIAFVIIRIGRLR